MCIVSVFLFVVIKGEILVFGFSGRIRVKGPG